MVDMIGMVIVVSGYLVILDSIICYVQFSLVLAFVSKLTLSCVFVATRFVL